MIIIIFFIAHWYISLFSQTFFLHRYSAHRMFSMNKAWEKFFYLILYFSQGSSYLTPRAYGILHRMHHAYSDTEKDPHSPHHNRNAFLMMWKTRKIYNDIVDNNSNSDPGFKKNLPEWKFIDQLGEMGISRIAWGIIYVVFYSVFATQWWMFLLLPIHFLMSPVHGAIVNWFGHKVGYSNFKNGDHSKNTLPVDILMLGELFQNNHHKYASRANFGIKKFEFDPVFPFIKLFSFFRIIKMENNLR